MAEYKPKAREIFEIFQKQDFRCYISNRKFISKSMVDIGHIIPLGKGGKHELENLCLFDKAFSGLKKYYTIDEIKQIVSEVIDHG